MSERSVSVTIGAVLQSSFRTSFREAEREVRSLANSLNQIGARRSNAGLLATRDTAQRLGGTLRALRTEVQATNRALAALDQRAGRVGAAIGSASAPIRSFGTTIGAAHRQITTTNTALDAQVTAINAAAQASRMASAALNQQIAAQQRLHSVMSRPLPTQNARTPVGGGAGMGAGGAGSGGHGGTIAGGAMGAAAGHAARHALFGAAAGAAIGGHALGKVYENAAEYQHQIIMRKQQAWSNEEIEQGKRESKRVARALRMFSETENMEVLGDLGFAMGDRHHAVDALEAVQRSSGLLKQARPEMDTTRNAFGAIKALEMLGHAGDKKTIDDYMEKMTAATIASGGKVTGADFQQFAKYAKGAGSFYSQDFLTTIAPSLMQELGASTAGNGLAMVRNALVGGRMTRAAANTLNEFGLMDPSKTDADMVGESGGIRGHGWIKNLSKRPGRYTGVTVGRGAIKNADLLQSDPYAWVQKELKPRLDAAGVTDPKQIGQVLAQMFSNSSAERAVSVMLLQANRLEKDRKQIEETRKTTSYEMVLNDPLLAATRLGKAFTDMTKGIGAPITAPIAHAMDGIGAAMYKIGEASPETISGFVKLSGVLVGLPALAWASQKAFVALGGGLRSVVGLARSPAFIGFAAAGYLVYKNWDWVKGFASEALPGLMTGFQRIGSIFDGIVSGAEGLLRVFGLIPPETDNVGKAFKEGETQGKKLGDLLGVALPAAAAIWTGNAALGIVTSMTNIGRAIIGLDAIAKGSVLWKLLSIASGGGGVAAGAVAGAILDKGMTDAMKPKEGDEKLFGSGPEAEREKRRKALQDLWNKPAPGNAIVVPQSYEGGGMGGLIHKSAFSGGATAQEQNSSESRFSEAVRRGTYSALVDFAGGRSAGRGMGGGGAGGMFQNASFSGSGGFGLGAGSVGGGSGGGYDAGGGSGGSIAGAGAPNEQFTGSNADVLKQAAASLGVPAKDLATVISYETGGKFSPSIRGGKGGNYQGLIQFGPAERAKYGVTGNETFGEQMPKVVQFLKDRGLKPGMGLNQLYATINGGNPYVSQNASDGNGTIASHVEKMQRTHGARAEAFLNSGSSLATPNGGGIGGGKGAAAADVAMQMEGLDEDRDTGKIRAFIGRDPRGAANAWCADFVNASLKAVGETGTGSGVATSFLKWGKAVNADIAQKGDVAVEARGRGAGQTGGHVGILTGNKRVNQKTGELELETISGNHSNKVKRDWDPASKLTLRRSNADAALAEAAKAQTRKAAIAGSGPKGSPGAGHKIEINAPITINPHPHQNPNDIGRAAANHVNKQTDEGVALRGSTMDWSA